VDDQGLRPSADVAAAGWLGPRLRRFGSAVAAVVPDGFPTYVRILHPARGSDGPSVGLLGRRGALPVPPAFSPEVLDGPRVRLPGRDYILFAGSLAAASELGWAGPRLEAWRVQPADPIASDSDWVNT
jgi:hypothetical protein